MNPSSNMFQPVQQNPTWVSQQNTNRAPQQSAAPQQHPQLASGLVEGLIRNCIVHYELVFGYLIPAQKRSQPSSQTGGRRSWQELAETLQAITGLHSSRLQDLAKQTMADLPLDDPSRSAEAALLAAPRMQSSQLLSTGSSYFDKLKSYCGGTSAGTSDSKSVSYHGQLTDIFRYNEPVVIGMDYPKPPKVVDDLGPSFNNLMAHCDCHRWIPLPLCH